MEWMKLEDLRKPADIMAALEKIENVRVFSFNEIKGRGLVLVAGYEPEPKTETSDVVQAKKPRVTL